MSDKVWFIDEGQAMSEEIIVGKVTYLGPTAIDPRDAEIERLRAALRDAKECIHIWHNMDCRGMDKDQAESIWQSYDKNSPEMKRLNAALEAKP